MQSWPCTRNSKREAASLCTTAAASSRVTASPLQLLPQETELQRQHVGPLRVVGRSAVAAFDVLVVQQVVALLEHAGGHLAGMARVHPIVARAGDEQHARQLVLAAHVLVRA